MQPPKTSLISKLPCLLKLPPAILEWSVLSLVSPCPLWIGPSFRFHLGNSQGCKPTNTFVQRKSGPFLRVGVAHARVHACESGVWAGCMRAVHTLKNHFLHLWTRLLLQPPDPRTVPLDESVILLSVQGSEESLAIKCLERGKWKSSAARIRSQHVMWAGNLSGCVKL